MVNQRQYRTISDS